MDCVKKSDEESKRLVPMRYPIGIQSFEKLRKEGYVYVDKTDLIHELAQGSICFLSRPRRFGKSLLMSTLKCYFEGRRDLFEGLKIMDLEQEWTRYPVISFDFNLGEKEKVKGLRSYILSVIAKHENQYAISPLIDDETNRAFTDVSLRFNHLVEELHQVTGRQVVVLVDEYDKPLLDLIDSGDGADEKLMESNRKLLKNFFSVFKAADAHLRFVFITGVTKFSQVTMFSGINQPDDISLDKHYDTLLGITAQELYTVFADSIRELADEEGKSEEEMKAMLKHRYDGYHFSEGMTDVYNPFSILNVLKKKKLRDYWFQTGTPAFVVRLMNKMHEDVMDYTQGEHQYDEFLNYKLDTARPLPMLFQAGYLTIKGYNPDFETYKLDFPNMEVRRGMITLFANDYLQVKGQAVAWVNKVVMALRSGDLDLVRKQFTAFLAETPYCMRPKKESEFYFHYTFYLLMRLISCYTVYTEKQLSEGRADCIVETNGYVYIFEFKLDGTSEEALQQIRERGYAKAYEADQRPVYIIGANFSSKTGTIEDWRQEVISE